MHYPVMHFAKRRFQLRVVISACGVVLFNAQNARWNRESLAFLVLAVAPCAVPCGLAVDLSCTARIKSAIEREIRQRRFNRNYRSSIGDKLDASNFLTLPFGEGSTFSSQMAAQIAKILA